MDLEHHKEALGHWSDEDEDEEEDEDDESDIEYDYYFGKTTNYLLSKYYLDQAIISVFDVWIFL